MRETTFKVKILDEELSEMTEESHNGLVIPGIAHSSNFILNF
jgi:hypothetical protein